MQAFTESLRGTFEEDWRAEESSLREQHQREVQVLMGRLAKHAANEAALTEEALRREAERQKAEEKAVEMEKEMEETAVEMEKEMEKTKEKLEAAHRDATWRHEKEHSEELLARESLTMKCLGYEREIAKLRAELQQVVMRGEDDHLVFRSAEATLQEELISLRKKILRNELEQDRGGCSSGVNTTTGGTTPRGKGILGHVSTTPRGGISGVYPNINPSSAAKTKALLRPPPRTGI